MEHTKIYLDPKIVSLSFDEFEKYHSRYFSHDTMTAKERYVYAGGTLPAEIAPAGKKRGR